MSNKIQDIKDEFVADLMSMPLEKVVSHWIFMRIPYVFNTNLPLFIDWKHELANLLKIDSASIFITGSSNIGISLNPHKNYKPFDENSDIDVAIISDYYFNEAWRYMRSLGASIHNLDPKSRIAIDDHVSRLIYWGTIATDKILLNLPFGREWNNALRRIGNYNPIKNRIVNARIYKDFESLRAYQILGMKALQNYELEKEQIDVKIS